MFNFRHALLKQILCPICLIINYISFDVFVLFNDQQKDGNPVDALSKNIRICNLYAKLPFADYA